MFSGKRTPSFFRPSFAFIALLIPLLGKAQSFYRGDPTTLEPKSAHALAGHMHTNYLFKDPATFPGGLNPLFRARPGISPNTTITAPFTPYDIQTAYNIPGNCGGEAIAVVDAYDLSTALADFNEFSNAFGLPQEASSDATASTNQVLQVVYASGAQPGSDIDSGWNIEEALDMEWAHAMAPNAKIYVVEANSDSGSDLYAADQVAAALPGVREVSNSWGGGEYSQELGDDSNWAYKGVSFFFSSGDESLQLYPSESVNVISVGGTSLTMTATGYGYETGWSGSGGGPSAYEPRPSFQNPVVNTVGATRGDPDCSAVADPNTGVYVYTAGTWYEVGGTSLSCPVVAGITNVREFQIGNFATSSQNEESRIYNNAMSSFYRDILSGTSGSESCMLGWDFVTGVGSPNGFLCPWSSGLANVPGNSNGLGSGAKKTTRWTLPTGHLPQGSPVVDANNFVYVTASNGNLYAADGGTGIIQWAAAVPSAEGSPALDSFGTLFVSAGNTLYSINAKAGTTNWTFPDPDSFASFANPVVGSGDIVYLTDSTGYLYAINGQTGNEVWEITQFPELPAVAPTLDSYGNLYYEISTGASGTLFSVDTSTRTINWQAAISEAPIGPPVVGPKGLLYVTAANALYGVDIKTGDTEWTYSVPPGSSPIPNAIANSPAVASNGNAYFNDSAGNFYAVSSSGSLVWEITLATTAGSTPAIGADGTLYLGDSSGNLYSINPKTGTTNWSFVPGNGGLNWSPAIGADGTVYVGDASGDLIAVGTSVFASLSTASPVTGSVTETAVLTLAQPPAKPITVDLTSNNGAAQVPATVNVPAGVAQATFKITYSVVSVPQSAVIEAQFSNSIIGTAIELEPFGLAKIVADPATVTGGANSAVVVMLKGPAGPGGTVVELGSNNPAVTVPATATVLAGNTEVAKTISTSAVSTVQTVTVRATFNGVTLTTIMTVEPSGLRDLNVFPSKVTGGTSATGTLELGGPAGPHGNVVSLSSNDSSVIVPAVVSVPAGQTTKTFSIATEAVNAASLATIVGSFNGKSLTATLTVEPAGLLKVETDPVMVTGGSNSAVIAILNGPAGSNGASISLSSNNSAASVPGPITIASGAISGSQPLTTAVVSTAQVATIKATLNGASLSATLTVEPHGLMDLSLSPSSILGGTSVTLTVTLSGVAGSPSGNVISLSSNSSAVTVPATITVSGGGTTKSISLATSTVTSTTKVTVTASFNGKSMQASVSLSP